MDARIFGCALFASALMLSSPLMASDTVLLNGKIYTGNPKTPWAQALAISAGRIEAVATNETVAKSRTPAFLADLERARTLYHDDWVSANLVKFFADDGPGFAYAAADYQALITELDKRGFALVTHAINPVAVHSVLDAYEALVKTNGAKDRRLRMEHLFNIPAGDAERLKKLSIVAGMQPSFCCGTTDPEDKAQQWGSVQKAGAALTFSSDWPCTFPPDPLVGIQEAVTRGRYAEGHIGVIPPTQFTARAGMDTGGPLAAGASGQRLTVEQALTAYLRGAYADFANDRLGTLETGKYADLAVLSGNVFDVRPEQIGSIHVDLTMVDGKVVFTREKSP